VNDQAMVQTCKNQGDAASKAVGWQYTKNSVGRPQTLNPKHLLGTRLERQWGGSTRRTA
jgi:hypothetical protein